jgi:hypothetical protein
MRRVAFGELDNNVLDSLKIDSKRDRPIRTAGSGLIESTCQRRVSTQDCPDLLSMRMSVRRIPNRHAIQQRRQVLLIHGERVVAGLAAANNWQVLWVRLIEQYARWQMVTRISGRATVNAACEHAVIAQRSNVPHVEPQAGTALTWGNRQTATTPHVAATRATEIENIGLLRTLASLLIRSGSIGIGIPYLPKLVVTSDRRQLFLPSNDNYCCRSRGGRHGVTSGPPDTVCMDDNYSCRSRCG